MESECMVKLGFYVVKKRGKKGIREYEEVYMRFPEELHNWQIVIY
jgi:hypothetical protein